MQKQVLLVGLFVFLVVLVLLQSAPFVTAEGKTIIVGNTKDWHSLYLASVYSSLNNASFFFFNNLGDAQLKTKTMGLTDEIIVFESTIDPVIKNYKSFLAVDGFTNFKSYTFETFEDLQELLVEKHSSEGYVVFGTDFGMEPLAATPFLIRHNYMPLFYSENSYKFIAQQTKKATTMFVGRIPVRDISSLKGTRFIGSPPESTTAMSKISINTVPSEWGIITRIDVVDFQTFQGNTPIFVYYGESYLDSVAKLMTYSNITHYEVIGGKTADIATTLETRTGKDLSLMLKYGRRITNQPGLENNVLDIVSYPFSFPVEDLLIVKSVYYPELEVLAITYENVGNIDLLYFSNIEYSNNALADEYAHQIFPGETKTVPYRVINGTAQKLSITSYRLE